MRRNGLRRSSRVYERVYGRPMNVILDVDLNITPPQENDEEDSQPTFSNVPIDVEALDDDVVISSPRHFPHDRNLSRRNHQVTVILDEDSEFQQETREEPSTVLSLNSYSVRGYPSHETVVDFINLEDSHSAKKKVRDAPNHESIPATKEYTFTCPVCMGPLVEETSTICGHIFCRECIKASIAAQKRCPTCRHKLTMSNIHRVYLPATN